MGALQTRTAGEQLQTAMHMLGQIKPEGALQSMLAVQMIGVHNTAVRFLMRATDVNQTFEGTDANVQRSVRLLRLFNEQLQALASLRGGRRASKGSLWSMFTSMRVAKRSLAASIHPGGGVKNGN
jgi:hypothetical protein